MSDNFLSTYWGDIRLEEIIVVDDPSPGSIDESYFQATEPDLRDRDLVIGIPYYDPAYGAGVANNTHVQLSLSFSEVGDDFNNLLRNRFMEIILAKHGVTMQDEKVGFQQSEGRNLHYISFPISELTSQQLDQLRCATEELQIWADNYRDRPDAGVPNPSSEPKLACQALTS